MAFAVHGTTSTKLSNRQTTQLTSKNVSSPHQPRSVVRGRHVKHSFVHCTHQNVRSTTQVQSSDDQSRVPRRQLLTGLAVVIPFLGAEQQANAGFLDDLAEAKRNSQAKFLLGPIRLGRQRIGGVLDAAASGSPAAYADAREVLRSASLDCVNPSDGLSLYAQSRDVCTYSIIHRSVTKGPAAKNPMDTSEGAEATEALIDLVSQLRSLDLILLKSSEGNEQSQSELSPAVQVALERFDRFEISVQRCLGLEPDLGYNLAPVFEGFEGISFPGSS